MTLQYYAGKMIPGTESMEDVQKQSEKQPAYKVNSYSMANPWLKNGTLLVTNIETQGWPLTYSSIAGVYGDYLMVTISYNGTLVNVGLPIADIEAALTVTRGRPTPDQRVAPGSNETTDEMYRDPFTGKWYPLKTVKVDNPFSDKPTHKIVIKAPNRPPEGSL